MKPTYPSTCKDCGMEIVNEKHDIVHKESRYCRLRIKWRENVIDDINREREEGTWQEENE